MNRTAPIRSATRKLAFVRVVMASTKVEYIAFILTQRLEAGGWGLEAGGGRLECGGGRPEAGDKGFQRLDGALTSSQKRASFNSVIRWPRSRSRLISINFNPASRPAACSALGRPRTTTRVCDDGPPCTIAPARRAARIASLRGRARIPVNARWTPLRERSVPVRNCVG